MSRKTYFFILLALLLSLVITACGGADEPEEVEEPAPTEEVTTAEEETVDEEATAEAMAMADEEATAEAMAMADEEATAEAMAMADEEATAEAEAMAEEEMGPDLSGVTISFWHVFRSGGQAEGMTEIVADFNDTNEWGITVEDFAQGGQSDLEEAVNAAIATGELPNVTLGFANAMSNWYSVGVIAPINDYLSDPDYGLSDEAMAGLYAGPFNQGTLADGTQIGIPMHQSEQVIFYNFSWARELGFDAPPATSAEFKEQACAAAEANANDDDPDNDGTGGLVHFPGASNIAAWVFAFGGDLVNEAGDAYTLNSPVVKDVALFLWDLENSGCTFATDSFPNPEMATRKALFTTSSTAGIPFQASAFEDAGNDDEWGLIPFPGPDGNLAVNAFGQLIGIVDTNEEQNLASWLFIRYLTSPEVQAKWINFTAYFPSQSTTVPLLGDYAGENPLWNEGLELATLGKSEPNLASYGSVRGAIQDAFFAVGSAADEAEIDTILADLDATAAELLAESQ